MVGEQAIPSWAHSLEHVLGRIMLAIAGLIRLRPDLPRLTRLAQECHRAAVNLLASELGAHDTSRLQPPQRNTSFGAFRDYPHYSALTGVAPKEFMHFCAEARPQKFFFGGTPARKGSERTNKGRELGKRKCVKNSGLSIPVGGAQGARLFSTDPKHPSGPQDVGPLNWRNH
ncbi:hypothetical protein C6N40_01735 [Arenimonas caeni]|uniref:Uncharacterized protein n=1 Tax=Arenimonas caeni TaxID=2058085 RepID=A0A2P6MBQ9_9GAMM|nr:hypothetical protein C6N40_01735 [Arenimonas caeni]